MLVTQPKLARHCTHTHIMVKNDLFYYIVIFIILLTNQTHFPIQLLPQDTDMTYSAPQNYF